MTAITITGLTKRFGSTTAVDSIDLKVESGELFFLLGPSGCGKTTLLRMIAGFIEPTAGTIRFGDRDVTNVPPNKRNAGMVFQSYALWPHMSVEDNVAYGLVVRKVEANERRRRVAAALDVVHMQDYAKRKPNQLSGGQQQRVALARALVIQPTVLLLDEPLSNLDAKLRLEMRTEIRRICSETRITTVYVTHDQKEALSMADNMAVLRSGKIMQIGPPRLLYDRPSSRFVADFLGESNFVTGVVESVQAEAISIKTSAGLLRAMKTSTETKHVGEKVMCSIRPEALRLVRERGASNTFVGTRVRSMYLGEMAQHVIELEDRTQWRALELHPIQLGAAGESVMLTVDPKDVVLVRE